MQCVHPQNSCLRQIATGKKGFGLAEWLGDIRGILYRISIVWTCCVLFAAVLLQTTTVLVAKNFNSLLLVDSTGSTSGEAFLQPNFLLTGLDPPSACVQPYLQVP